jgi:hypothetical protein
MKYTETQLFISLDVSATLTPRRGRKRTSTMARIPEAEVQRLKDEVSVQRLVEAAGIELRKVGKDIAGRCPFHEDSEPSLIVTPAKNLWHCFGCR